ncbi:hypothetical protein M23134_07047 [Microscilla marina ATCC 23134]|uniref:Uncharacterized protein n=1 Tax=Microscilla marina ATCC 23134 TaxID=313606 RepID=A1ZT62_MICM2|nr:hypothetical protein M23134_07047 [Microscilla marina ATCC 23134]
MLYQYSKLTPFFIKKIATREVFKQKHELFVLTSKTVDYFVK